MSENPPTPAAKDVASSALALAPCSAPSRWHWLWVWPLAVTFSPIGWIAGTAYFRLSFYQSCGLAMGMALCVFLLGAVTNWGE